MPKHHFPPSQACRHRHCTLASTRSCFQSIMKPNCHSSSVSYHTCTRSPGQPTIRQRTHPAIETPTQPDTQVLTHSLIHFLILNQQTPPGAYVLRDLRDRSNVIMCTICASAGASALAPSSPSLLPGSLTQAKRGVGCKSCVSLSL